MPVRLKIHTANINIPIEPAAYNDDKWMVSHKGASYLVSSPLPGRNGNSILYGHNWPSILGNLSKTNPGDKIEIEYNNSKKEFFKIVSKGIVTPDQTHVLQNTKDSRITIYTCTGFLDSKRLVITAEPADDPV